MQRYKFPRTTHFPYSPNRSQDDLVADPVFDGDVVATVKMDGECTTIYSDGYCHARSIDSGYHDSRSLVKRMAVEIGSALPSGWRICGENLYAKHSIHYTDLSSFFYAFAIFDDSPNGGTCLPWDDFYSFVHDNLNPDFLPTPIFRGPYSAAYIRSLAEIQDGEEGLVVRPTKAFAYSDYSSIVRKYVRGNHVVSSDHWMYDRLVKNELAREI